MWTSCRFKSGYLDKGLLVYGLTYLPVTQTKRVRVSHRPQNETTLKPSHQDVKYRGYRIMVITLVFQTGDDSSILSTRSGVKIMGQKSKADSLTCNELIRGFDSPCVHNVRLAEWLGVGLQNRLHRFKSCTDLKYASVVQLVEHWSPKPVVGGSSPSRRAKVDWGST